MTLWIGERLGAVERACMRSVLRHGHRLSLYCYSVPHGIPEGVEVRDASKILPESAVFRHGSGSVGHFSDWFRYELQRRGVGTWLDTDVYLLQPLDGNSPNLFGEQAPGMINNAVLRLVEGSPMLRDLIRPFEQRSTPDWLPLRSYLPARFREILVGEADLGRLPWGSTGPHALTVVAQKHAFASQALPSDVFYPVPWQRADWILDPKVSPEDLSTDRTVAVHLWNECIRTFKEKAAPSGSFLNRLHEEGA